MAVHHLALATAKLEATHAFYTEAMGFDLVKVVSAPTPQGGWAKHVFYDTGDGLIAFWDLHVDAFPEVHGGMSTAVGLPEWVNHVAFLSPDRAHLDASRKRWLDLGIDVMEVDHEFCRSIYATDPNGTMVEWCMDNRPLDEGDRERAIRDIADPHPPFDEGKPFVEFHQADPSLRPSWLP